MLWIPKSPAIVVLLCFILCFGCVVTIDASDQIDDGETQQQPVRERIRNGLPEKSTEFVSTFSCHNIDTSQYDDTFFRWVVAGRHTTWLAGWEVVVPNYSSDTNITYNDNSSSEKEKDRFYARVFELLNWSRQHRLLPRLIGVEKVCHKGMEIDFQNEVRVNSKDGGASFNSDAPNKPNAFIPSDTWGNLWTTCKQKLDYTARVSSSCLDVPGVVVANTNPPLKVNNPCQLEYRMVDGAHRLCLRKYLLSLLSGELIGLQNTLVEKQTFNVNDAAKVPSIDELQSQIKQKKKLIYQYSHGSFFVLNQTTFESMLTNSDPYTSWLTNENVMKDITPELKLDWKRWMGEVMESVREKKERMLAELSDSTIDYGGIDTSSDIHREDGEL
eukprot:scaffold427_cov103-Alexandrium_tamarense.AAC.5